MASESESRWSSTFIIDQPNFPHPLPSHDGSLKGSNAKDMDLGSGDLA